MSTSTLLNLTSQCAFSAPEMCSAGLRHLTHSCTCYLRGTVGIEAEMALEGLRDRMHEGLCCIS